MELPEGIERLPCCLDERLPTDPVCEHVVLECEVCGEWGCDGDHETTTECGCCNGTGEGSADGVRCRECRGTGTALTSYGRRLADEAEEDAAIARMDAMEDKP